jgi:hypothetical protein
MSKNTFIFEVSAENIFKKFCVIKSNKIHTKLGFFQGSAEILYALLRKDLENAALNKKSAKNSSQQEDTQKLFLINHL